MYRLKNEYLTAEFDDKARLIFLENNQNGAGNVIAAPAESSFKLVYKLGEDWENAVHGKNQEFEAEQNGNKLTFRCKACKSLRHAPDLSVTLNVELDGSHLVYSASIENKDDILITDFTYPVVGAVQSLGSEKPVALLWPSHCGERYSNIGAYLWNMPGKRGASGSKQPPVKNLALTYPGGWAKGGSMQWMALTDDKQTLAFSSRDPMFYASELKVSGSDSVTGAVNMSMTRLPFAKQGEVWESAPVLVSLYRGDWHRAAREYRDWARTWRNVHPKPEWIKDMQGYFLVIMKQQFGTEMWRYDELPKLYELAKAHGCDAVGLFGWYDSGHDNQYPDLVESESLGGRKTLEENLKKVQQEGGHVTLYHQGHLIDVTTDFYKNGDGHKCESVSRWGTPYLEAYNKAHKSYFLSHFTNKQFSNACPSSPEWQDLIEEKTEWISSFGSDGVLFDQIGGMYPYPCFNEDHPHALGKPSLSMSQGRIKLLGRIQSRTKKLDPEFCFMTEHITDLYSAYADCLHGLYLSCFQPGERADADLGEKPLCINYPELFRYCFPETDCTIRNARPFIEEREANFAFLFGFKLEMEVRYQADREDILNDCWPRQREYSRKLADLRRKYWDVMGRGDYVDTDCVQNGDPRLLARSFVKDGKMVLALWNDSGEPVSLKELKTPGWKAVEASGIDGTLPAVPETLAAGQILAVLCEKEAF